MAKYGLTGVAIVAAAVTATSFSGPSGSNTVINAPSSQDIVYQLAGTEVSRLKIATCSATGGNVKVSGGAKYDTCYMASPLTTTGALKSVEISCGNVALALPGDLGFVKSANGGTGTALANFSNVSLGTGSYIYNSSGVTLWNSADKLKFGTLTPLTGTLSAARYDCVMTVRVDDIYGR